MKRLTLCLMTLMLALLGALVPCALAEDSSSFEYVLPAADEITVGGCLRIDFMLSRSGRVIFTVLSADGAQQARFGVNKEKNVPTHYNWYGSSGDGDLPAGSYTLTVRHERDGDAQTLRFPLTIREKAQIDDVSLTDDLLFLPASKSDEDVWAAMQSPIFTADAGERAHQKIYVSPDTKSAVAGAVHGQTQALKILASPQNGFVRVGFYRHEDGDYTEGYIKESALICVVPNARYGILIDKQAQTLTVYIDGKPFSTVPVTTGLNVKGDSERETRAGAFVTSDHLKAFSSHGMAYEYPIGFDGGNLIHQLGYRKIDGVKNFNAERELLGQKDSHGCVRMPEQANADGLNARWLYTHIPYHTKVLVLDDPEARAARMDELTRTPTPVSSPTPTPSPSPTPTPSPSPTPTATFTPAPTFSPTPVPFGVVLSDGAALPGMEHTPSPTPTFSPSPAPSPSPTPSPLPTPTPAPVLSAEEYLQKLPSARTQIVITAGGDCVLGSEESTRSSPFSFDSMIERTGYDWPFSRLKDLFQTDDVTYVNLECVLKNSSADKASGRMYNFRGPSEYTEILAQGGVDLVNIANNHYIDYGAKGKRATRDALTAAGIPYSGYGFTYIYEKDGIKIGFGGIRETIYLQNPAQVDKDIAVLKNAGCDAIVYACHFGKEYSRVHSELQTEIAHRAVDAGADIVIGHHPHVVQGVEIYKNCPIFYSLGNLVFGGNLTLSEFDAALARLTLDFSEGKYMGVRVRVVPILDTGSAPANDFRPVVALDTDAERILKKMQDDSRVLLSPDEMGFLR